MTDDDFYSAWFQKYPQRDPGKPVPTPEEAAAAPEILLKNPMDVRINQLNPVPSGYNPFAPGHKGPAAPASQAPLTPLNQLTASLGQPDGAPTPTPAVGPKPPADLTQTNFNSFLGQILAAANANPTGNLDAFKPEHQALILRQTANKEDDVLYQLEEELRTTRRKRAEAEMKALQPLWDKQDRQLAAMQGDMAAARAALPEWKPAPTISPTDVQAFMMGALGVALIGGLAGKASWLQVTAS
ncbi:MAG: hypothetical protein HRJ53_00035, partial [Acidobacteria bacterium Pan2503]|nr:hypothetical protein [Candidatus Acidoferrum panamensis]